MKKIILFSFLIISPVIFAMEAPPAQAPDQALLNDINNLKKVLDKNFKDAFSSKNLADTPKSLERADFLDWENSLKLISNQYLADIKNLILSTAQSQISAMIQLSQLLHAKNTNQYSKQFEKINSVLQNELDKFITESTRYLHTNKNGTYQEKPQYIKDLTQVIRDRFDLINKQIKRNFQENRSYDTIKKALIGAYKFVFLNQDISKYNAKTFEKEIGPWKDVLETCKKSLTKNNTITSNIWDFVNTTNNNIISIIKDTLNQVASNKSKEKISANIRSQVGLVEGEIEKFKKDLENNSSKYKNEDKEAKILGNDLASIFTSILNKIKQDFSKFITTGTKAMPTALTFEELKRGIVSVANKTFGLEIKDPENQYSETQLNLSTWSGKNLVEWNVIFQAAQAFIGSSGSKDFPKLLPELIKLNNKVIEGLSKVSGLLASYDISKATPELVKIKQNFDQAWKNFKDIKLEVTDLNKKIDSVWPIINKGPKESKELLKILTNVFAKIIDRGTLDFMRELNKKSLK